MVVAGSRELRDLNRRFRGKDKPTDVLSFSSAGTGEDAEGDIAISADIATENATRLGHRPADELKILVLHGLLHLAGYDHESDTGQMARRESSLRQQLRLPQALIQRATADGKNPQGDVRARSATAKSRTKATKKVAGRRR